MTLKRMTAPNWPIERKTKKFVVKPRPGPHSTAECMPLALALRDVLKYARNMEEARQLLNEGHVMVDGAVRKRRGFPIGLMDVISLDKEHYRVVVGKKGLTLKKIKEGEAGLKLLRIENKVHVSGKTQLNFHDGRNLLVDGDSYKTGDVALFDLQQKKIRETAKLEKGSLAVIIKGNNMGAAGSVENIIITKSSMENQVVLNLGEKSIILPKSYVFVTGKGKPLISMGE